MTHALFFFLGIAACDTSQPSVDDDKLHEGQRLQMTEYSDHQPASRQAYKETGTFVDNSKVFFFWPGSGPGDPPRLIRSIALTGLRADGAQVDRDGFTWVATPDPLDSRVHYAAYIIDPHTATVHRVIDLPNAVRATSKLVIGPERVYLRSIRNGFSGGVGTVDRRCAFDASLCDVSLLLDLGNVGDTQERAFHLTPEALFSFSGMNSRDRRSSVDRIDLRSGDISASSSFSGEFAFDRRSLYSVSYFEPGIASLVRLDKQTLEKTGQVEVGDDASLIAHEGGLIYLSDHLLRSVEVRSAETLEIVRTFDVSSSGGVHASFGFVAPGVLLLNGTSSLDVTTGQVLLDPAHGVAQLGFGPRATTLPEGHPLAY